MRIKSRRAREKEYHELYGDISTDIYTRLKDKLGDKFNEDTMESALNRISEIHNNTEYTSLEFTFYEVPVQSNRPRTNYKFHNMYVPNAKANFDSFAKFIKSLNKVLKIVAVPMRIDMRAYLAMPSSVNPVETIVYETENDFGIGKPDCDNIIKAYYDMIQKHLILDDDLVVTSSCYKYFSLKPRVILTITYPNGFASEYAYKLITSRKSYKEIQDCVDASLLVTPYKKSKSKKR